MEASEFDLSLSFFLFLSLVFGLSLFSPSFDLSLTSVPLFHPTATIFKLCSPKPSSTVLEPRFSGSWERRNDGFTETFPELDKPSPTLSKPTRNPSRFGSLLLSSRLRMERWVERRSCSRRLDRLLERIRSVYLSLHPLSCSSPRASRFELTDSLLVFVHFALVFTDLDEIRRPRTSIRIPRLGPLHHRRRYRQVPFLRQTVHDQGSDPRVPVQEPSSSRNLRPRSQSLSEIDGPVDLGFEAGGEGWSGDQGEEFAGEGEAAEPCGSGFVGGDG